MKINILIYTGQNIPVDINREVLGISLIQRQIEQFKQISPENIVMTSGLSDIPEGRIMLINASFFIHPVALKDLIQKDSAYYDKSGFFALTDSSDTDLIQEFLKNGQFNHQNYSPEIPGYRIYLDSEQKIKTLKKELFLSLRKPVDGLVARNINRKVSFFLTEYFFIPLHFSPNMTTLITAVIGILSGFAACKGTWYGLILGTFLGQAASILDGCDGEIARLTYKTSRLGQWFDSISDSIVNTSLMIGLGYGLEPFFGSLSVYIGWLTVGVSWFSNFVIYWDVIVIRKTTDVFAFSWWFEKKERKRTVDLTKPLYEPVTFFAFLKYLTRRDMFFFVYFVLALISPSMIMGAFILTAVFVIPSLFITVFHIYFGIIRKLIENPDHLKPSEKK